MCEHLGTDWETTAKQQMSQRLEAEAAIQRVLDLHKPESCNCGEYGIKDCTGFCIECSTDDHGVDFPCATIRALEGEQG